MTLPRIKGSGPALEAEDHDRNMLFLSGFPSLAAMLADTARGYDFYEAGQGLFVLAEGYRYIVAASNTSDQHLTTAAGLKLYVVPSDEGVYNFGAFAPAANGVTDDYAKLMTALGAVETGLAPNKVGPIIFFPKGAYKINTTVELHNKVTLLGAGGVSSATALVFSSGVSGFVVNAFNTGDGTAISEEDATIAGLSGAGGSIFKDLHFASGSIGAKPAARADVDGLWMRAPATIINCSFGGWPGAGIRIEAWAPADKPSNPELWGDANGWYVEHVAGASCGKSPLRVRGTRAGGGTCSICNFNSNGWWGFDDHATGTNIYVSNHTATNGVGASAANTGSIRKSGMVSYGGSRYRAKAIFGADGDPDPDHLQALVDTVPGTDEDVWQFREVGGASTHSPLWVPGQSAGQYFPSGGFKFSNAASGHVNLGGYCEDDEAGSYYNGENVFVAGGIQTYRHQGALLNGKDGRPSIRSGVKVEGPELLVTVAENNTNRRGITVTKDGEFWNLFNMDDAGDTIFGKEGETPSMIVTGKTPANDYGNSDPVTMRYRVQIPTIGLGEDPRRQTRLAAAPTNGKWAQGDIVWNRDPVAGGDAAWICTAAGTPGTWKACLPIEF